MNILGINNNHNATVVYLKEGKIIDCLSEERFVGVKNYIGIPTKAIRYLINKHQLSSEKIDLVCLGYCYGGPMVGYFESSTFFQLASQLREGLWTLANYLPVFREIETQIYQLYVKNISRQAFEKERQSLANLLKIPLKKIVGFDHHQAHAAAAYFSSPFNHRKSLVFTLDSEGDLLCATVWLAQKDELKLIAKTPVGNSLARIYQEVTVFLGMKPNEHEYKVMGLAPYAKDVGVKQVYDQIRDWVGFSKKDRLVFQTQFHTGETQKILQKKIRRYRFDNVAGAFQRLVEEKTVEWVKRAIKKIKVRTVVFGGGFFMNVKVNQKIAQLEAVKEAFFMPSGGDESTSIGAAYLGYLDLCRKFRRKPDYRPITNLYWGPSYSNKEVAMFIQGAGYRRKYRVRKLNQPEKTVAKLLAQGKIVARMVGRMEWGARALGNRSILANPSDFAIVRILNEQVKNRDFWMPFTPSILTERAADYFKNPKKILTPFMVLAFNSTTLAQRELKATMHPYDFTIRPQVVEKEINPEYYAILKEFERLTGIGGVLNTSFNLHGYPIVLGPKEAMLAFENSGLRYLLMENYLISKR